MIQQGMGADGMVSLQWSGDLTVRRIAELKEQIREALQSTQSVSIEIDADAVCDITVLQLLCSAHRTASAQGKALQLAGEFPEQFRMVLGLAGFSRHIGCVLDVCGSCLWKLIYQQSVNRENSRVGTPTCVSI